MADRQYTHVNRPRRLYMFDRSEMADPTPLDASWAAGIIEGEGCVRIEVSTVRDFRTKRPMKDRATMSVCVHMKDGLVVAKMVSMFGGHYYQPRPGFHAWTASSGRALWVLQVVRPFMVGDKAPQADLAIEFQSGRIRGRRPVGRAEYEMDAAKRISAMKKVGIYDSN